MEKSPVVKREVLERANPSSAAAGPVTVIELSSSGSDSEVEDCEDAASSPGKRARVPASAAGAGAGRGGGSEKRVKKHKADSSAGAALPLGFLDPLPPEEGAEVAIAVTEAVRAPAVVVVGSRQFWRAGDFEGDPVVDALPLNGNFLSFHIFSGTNFIVLISPFCFVYSKKASACM